MLGLRSVVQSVIWPNCNNSFLARRISHFAGPAYLRPLVYLVITKNTIKLVYPRTGSSSSGGGGGGGNGRIATGQDVSDLQESRHNQSTNALSHSLMEKVPGSNRQGAQNLEYESKFPWPGELSSGPLG